MSVCGFIVTNPTPDRWGVVVDLLTQDASYAGVAFRKNSFEFWTPFDGDTVPARRPGESRP